MISLGQHDRDIDPARLDQFRTTVATTLGNEQDGFIKDDAGIDKRPFQEIGVSETMTVLEIQQALKDAGFFPGGIEDGIYGYRTRSAVRLFQEYVRSIERNPCKPDGLFGKESRSHLQRWRDNNIKADWTSRIELWRRAVNDNNLDLLKGTEYGKWLAFLNEVKSHYAGHPNKMIDAINAFEGKTNTIKPPDWDFGPNHIHMIGIRRGEAAPEHKFDDVFMLLIKGLVFKFQGSTEPGASKHELGPPFAVQGQHIYRFGWHRKTYLALRPLPHGVLIVRSKDFSLTEADLDRGLFTESSINIHWGGRGVDRKVSSWSEGCQVIAGTAYVNHNNDPISCSEYAATRSTDPLNSISSTRGAYNVLSDVVTALSGDMGSDTVKYMLLMESDLRLDPEVEDLITKARQTASELKRQIGA